MKSWLDKNAVFIVFWGMVLVVVVTILCTLASCAPASVDYYNERTGEQLGRLWREVDEEYGIVCYSRGMDSLQCLYIDPVEGGGRAK